MTATRWLRALPRQTPERKQKRTQYNPTPRLPLRQPTGLHLDEHDEHDYIHGCHRRPLTQLVAETVEMAMMLTALVQYGHDEDMEWMQKLRLPLSLPSGRLLTWARHWRYYTLR